MAGPVTMALGPYKFQAHGFGLTGLTRKLDTSWAELETVGRLNALQWTGPRTETVTISGVLFPKEFGGDSSLEGIRNAALHGLPKMLVTSGGKVFGLQAIQSIEEDRGFIDRTGQAARIAYTIEMKQVSTGFSLLSLLSLLGVI